MKKIIEAVAIAVFIVFFIVAVSYAGTDKDSGTVCQGSTCNSGTDTVPSFNNVGNSTNSNTNIANGGAGGSASAGASSLSIANGGNAVANGGNASSSSVGIGGGANVHNTNVGINSVDNKVKNTNNNNVKNTNNNNVKNTNKNSNKQAQGQAQKQGQAQGQAQSVKNANAQSQSVNNGQTIAPVQNVVTEAPRLAAPTVSAQEVPILQGGKIGDVTAALPNFFGIVKLQATDQIVRVVKVMNGGIFTKIRLEDVPEAILNGTPAGAKIRIQVWAKDGVTAVTTGGGVAASQSVGANAATGSILPGWASSNANPAFVIFVYEVK